MSLEADGACERRGGVCVSSDADRRAGAPRIITSPPVPFVVETCHVHTRESVLCGGCAPQTRSAAQMRLYNTPRGGARIHIVCARERI